MGDGEWSGYAELEGKTWLGGDGGVGLVVRVVGGRRRQGIGDGEVERKGDGGWEIGNGWMSDKLRMSVRE